MSRLKSRPWLKINLELGRGEPEEEGRIAVLASLKATMDDIDARINELAERTRNLDLD